MDFESAWVLLLAPPILVYLAWFSLRGYAQLSPAIRRASLAVRIAMVCLLLAGLARPGWLMRSSANHVVFLVDASQSISSDNIDAAIEAIDRLAGKARDASSNTRFTLAAFGQSTDLLLRGVQGWGGVPIEAREQLTYARGLPQLYEERTRLISSGASGDREVLDALNRRIERIELFRDAIAGSHTDIDRGLRLALNIGAEDERRTIYLLTDGNFNRGRAADALAGAGPNARVHAIPLDRPAPPEVAAADLQLPESVRVDQGFSADLRIASTIETEAEIRIFKDGYLHKEMKAALRAGDNLVKISGLYFRDKGFHAVEASIKAPADTQLANNRIRSIVVVPGEARVLYVDRDVDQIPFLKGALELEGMNVEARSSAGVPQSLTELLSFDAFVLCNVPADRLTMRQMQMIRTYVQDFGGGFLMLGGDESFGLGGYYNTPIEEILPVRMPIQKDLLRPSLALFLVIDKSGSMEGAKIQIAKRAAIATAETINMRDLIGVIGFDGEARTLLELTPAGDRATVDSAIGQLDAGGGTFLYPALVEAHEKLNSSSARRKHVIVLSDGQTQGFGYDELVGSMASDGISLSAVGVGEGADINLMELIANAGGGRSYFTNDFSSIPQIFTREALRASRSMLVERLFQPVAVGEDPALLEIETDELPMLSGYVATTPRPAASTLIVSDSGDPILAKWRFGLGRTAAYTSEPKPRWAEDWIEWDDFAKFWSQLVRSVTSQTSADARYLEAAHRIDGDHAVLTADVRDATGGFAQGVAVELAASAGGRTVMLPVTMQGPGLFEARFPGFKYGEDQQFIWRIRDASTPATRQPATAESPENSDAQTTPYGFAYAFSPEFATLGANREALAPIAQRSGGLIMTLADADFAPAADSSPRRIALWPYLLIFALLLAPVDILIRRWG